MGETHVLKIGSTLNLTALANMRLSEFTMFSGRVSPGSKTSPTIGSTTVDVFPRKTIRLSLNDMAGLSAHMKEASSVSSSPAVSADSVSCSTSIARGPNLRHARNGMPSGPVAESGDLRTAVWMSCRVMFQIGSCFSGRLSLYMSSCSQAWKRASSTLRGEKTSFQCFRSASAISLGSVRI